MSVVIPAFNEEAGIVHCLQALQAQSLSSDQFEVILLDNGSTDSTTSVATNNKGNLHLTVISQARSTVSAARNHAAAEAQGEILALLDADCIAPPDWLSEAIRLAQPATLWGGFYLIPADATFVGRVWAKYQTRNLVGEVSFLPGGCIFLHKSDFLKIGGFDESIETSEDVDLCSRAKLAGMKILAFSSLEVIHEGTPRTLLHFYKQNRWHGKNVLKVFVRGLPSMRYLPVVFFSFFTLVSLIGFVAALIFRWKALLLIALVCLLAPSFALAFRRAKLSRDLPGLFVLYLVYSVSRATSLLTWREAAKKNS